MRTLENLDAIEGGGWGVFIASNHILAVGWFCSRWTHRTVRWRTRQVLFIVRCTPRQHARWGSERVDRWNPCPVVAPNSLVPHRTCPVTPDFCRALFITVQFCSRPLTPNDCCSAGSPDMSGAHRTVR
jgi:hypothetical protein